jgi:hypothetical protein
MSEGASNPRWHHIVNTMPFSDPKTAVQLGGRPIRKSEGKTVGYFWDFVDSNPMAKHMALARWKALGKNMKAVTAYVADATGPTTKFIASATKETQNNKSA